MPGALDICNQTLTGYLGEMPITSLDEATVPAQALRVLYATTRDALLESAWWRFATLRTTLGRLDYVPPSGFQFAYGLTLVPHCLSVIDLTSVDTSAAPWEYGWTSYPYRVELAQVATTLQRAVVTDLDAVALWYVARVDEGLFSGLFTLALATALAVQLATTLSGKASLLQHLRPLSERALQEAKRHDSHQDSPRQMPQNPRYLAVRLRDESSVFQVGPVSAPVGQPLGVHPA